jgi:hypothetical protein
MTFAEYAKVDAVNWSTLKHMRRSPLHYQHAIDHGRADTTRLALGRASHTAVLEPDTFMLHYACFKGERRAGKAWEEFKAAHKGETILKVDEYKTCLAIRDAVRRHPVASEYLFSGEAEQSLLWTDVETSLPCKGRIDWVSDSKPAIVDIKTTGDVDAMRFGATCARMLYHAQLAFYSDGYMAAYGKRPPVVIIAVEATPPHDVAVYVLDEDALYAGSEVYRELLMKVKSCRASKDWHGKYLEEQTLRLPSWAWPDDESDTGISDDISFGASSD